MLTLIQSTASHYETHNEPSRHHSQRRQHNYLAHCSNYRCLGTNELLKPILLALDTRDLALCLRVCRHWRSVIRASTEMQHTLFLAANGTAESFDYPLAFCDFCRQI